MGQLHYFFILAFCLLMSGTVYPDPRPRPRRDLAKATDLNDFDNLLSANQNMGIRIRKLRGDYNAKIGEVYDLENKLRQCQYEMQGCENLKSRNTYLEQQIVKLNAELENLRIKCYTQGDEGKYEPGPYSDLINQIQQDINSNDWTISKELIMKRVFAVNSEEYRFLANLKHFQILPLEAAAEGYKRIIETLIINGLNVNSLLGSSGNTMLHEAAGRDQIKVVEYLLSKGANVHVRGAHDRTAIHRAADSDALDTITILLKNGADINDQDYYGLTPLHIAVGKNRPKTVKFLVDHKADKSIKSKQDKTPLELAQISGFNNLLPYLYS